MNNRTRLLLEEAKTNALLRVNGNDFFIKDTQLFFDAFSVMLSKYKDEQVPSDVYESTQPDYQVIYMMLDKYALLNLKSYDAFVMQYIESLDAIQSAFKPTD